jgi:Cu+-exporting ATPase
MTKPGQLDLQIQGIHCAGCVATIERGLKKLPGVKECAVNLLTSSATVAYEPKTTSADTIIETIGKLGYGATQGTADPLATVEEETKKAKQDFLFALLLTVPVVVLAMLPMLFTSIVIPPMWDGTLQLIGTFFVLFVAGRSILADAWNQTRHFQANMNSLIALGSLAAFGWSLYQFIVSFGHTSHQTHYYFESAAVIITLILLGRYIEARTKQGAGKAVKELLALRPPTATAIINGVEVSIDSATLKPGMLVLVKAGERIPADGVITDGYTALDESMVTGESLPVEKRIEDNVIGGSVNGNFPFTLKVSTEPSGSFLAHVIRLVTEAQTGRPDIQRLADRVAGIFVPVVLGIAIVTGILWYVFAPESEKLVSSVIAVLIIACPCALGLATPTAILAGSSRAAKEGIIYRGGDVIERLTTVDTIVFDKTGTLTRGEFDVKEVHTYNGIDENTLLSLAAGIESKSEHHLGSAIVQAAKLRGIIPAEVQRVETIPGRGVLAKVGKDTIRIGNRAFLEEAGIGVAESRLDCATDLEKARTVVFISRNEKLCGIISFADRVRTESAEIVKWFNSRMQRVMLVSGDSYKTVQGVADAIGIKHISYEVKPDGKKTIVETLERSGMKVAMVGDGINDAPALAAATVGIAVGGGTDIAKESADLLLAGSDLQLVRRAFELASLTVKTIKQNLFWAFAYNVLAIPLAAGLFYPLFGWTLSPMIAAGAMAFSSMFVVLNSARLAKQPAAF